MSPERPVMPANTIARLLDGFDAVGLDTMLLLRKLGVARSYFAEPYITVPRAWFTELFQFALQQNPSPDLPARVGQAMPFGAYGLMEYMVGSAETVGSCFFTLALFAHLVSATFRLEFEHSDGDFVWLVNLPPEPTDWISDTWTLGIFTDRLSRFCDVFRLSQVYLFALEQASTTLFEAIYHAPVKTGAKRSGMRLVDGIWNAPLRTADPILHETLKNLAQGIELKEFQATPFAYHVRTQLAQAMPEGKFSAGEIADRLDLPLRTFQRRLSEEQISFKDLLDAYRHDLALKMLARPNTTMTAVAYALGYNEQSSFNHAFKRWTGKTPRAWVAERGGEKES